MEVQYKDDNVWVDWTTGLDYWTGLATGLTRKSLVIAEQLRLEHDSSLDI